MNILVLGNRGQLGGDLMQVLASTASVCGAGRPQLDIAELEQLRTLANEYEPDLIVNAAAYTDVEGAEDDEPGAFRVNETGARNVATVAAEHNIPVVYYSTDYVFGGRKVSPYEPDDDVAPIGVYARSKLAGEIATREETPDHYILRTAWLYGPGGNNFVEKILRAATTRDSLRVVEDEIGAPTHTLDLAEATRHLITTEQYGTYHCVNEGQCSRYEYACEILRLAGDDTPIEPCCSDEFPTKAERPLYSVLSNRKLIAATGYTPPDWKTALNRYMERRIEPADKS